MPELVPAGITAGPDGALWFTQQGINSSVDYIGRITTAGTVMLYAVPTSSSQPQGITSGPDGALWFTENFGNKIGRITTAGSIDEYPVPTSSSYPSGITVGPDGALWFTESSGSKIGRIALNGAITEYGIPLSGDGPLDITTGPDGELWFTDRGASWGTDIGQAVFVTANLGGSPVSGSYQKSLTFNGSGFAPNESVQIYTSGVGSAVLASGSADSSGSFTATARVPQTPWGPRLFLGTGQSSGRLGAASFSMGPRLVLNPTSGPPGTAVTVQGYGYGAEELVGFYWQNTKSRLGLPFTDANGTFSGSSAVTFTVPSTASPGTNTYVGIGEDTRAKAYAAFTVQ